MMKVFQKLISPKEMEELGVRNSSRHNNSLLHPSTLWHNILFWFVKFFLNNWNISYFKKLFHPIANFKFGKGDVIIECGGSIDQEPPIITLVEGWGIQIKFKENDEVIKYDASKI